MTPPLAAPAMAPVPALLTADQERALAAAIRAGRRARLLAQRHLAARLRRALPPTTSARTAAGAVLAALSPHLPLAPDALPAVVGPLLPHALPAAARAHVLAALDAWPLDQDALRAGHAPVWIRRRGGNGGRTPCGRSPTRRWRRRIARYRRSGPLLRRYSASCPCMGEAR